MRIIIQRVLNASVTIDKIKKSTIDKGILVLVGIEDSDTNQDIEWLTNKIINLRIFDDENGIMNLSIKQINGDILVVSQFTLFASTKKGNRPSYRKASKPEISIPLYHQFCDNLNSQLRKEIKTGEFGADMKVELINDGPVTIMIDSRLRE